VRRLATKDAHATQTYELRFPRGNGEGFLGAVGPAVEKLFADHPLRAGEIAGVDKEAALLLNPPPLSPWIMQTTIAASVASLGVAGAVGLFTALEVSSLDDRLRQSTTTVVDGGGLVRDHQRAVLASGVAWGALGVAASLGIAAGVLVPFTNFTADERDD
jgi:hypothetical protein